MKRFALLFGVFLLCIQSIHAANKEDILLQDFDLIAVNGNVATVVDFMELMSSNGKMSKIDAIKAIKQGLSNKMAHRIYNTKELGKPSPAVIYLAKYMGEDVYKREAKKSKFKGNDFAVFFWMIYISTETLIKLVAEFEAEIKKEFASNQRQSKKEVQENAQLA